MKTGAQVRQQHQLRLLFTGAEASFAVGCEGFAQEPLSLWRLAGAQCRTEARRFVRIETGVVAKDFEKAGELTADFLEDFLVAARDGIAGACKRCGRVECAKNGLMRRASPQLCAYALEVLCNAIENGGNLGRKAKTLIEGSKQIFLADGLSRLLGGPGRKGTPVCGNARESGDRLRDFIVALGDPEVAQDRIAESGDPIDLVDGWYAPRI